MVRKIEITDLATFVGIGSPQIAPNGKKVAFVACHTDLEANTYRNSIWIKNLVNGELYQLTSGAHDSHPRWSPDSKQLLFLSRRRLEEDEKGNELWSINATGRGEARLLLQRKGDPIQQPQWSPNGETILFRSRIGKEEDVKIVDRIPLWRGGAGFTYYGTPQLFLLDTNTRHVSQITNEDLGVKQATYAHSENKIAYTAKPKENKPLLSSLYIKSLQDGTTTKVSPHPMVISSLKWAPSDKQLALRGHTVSRGLVSHYNLYLLTLEDQRLENITEHIDKNFSSSLYVDAGKAVYGARGIRWKGNYIYFQQADHGTVSLHRIHTQTHEVEPLVKKKGAVLSYAINNDTIVYTETDAVTPPELYLSKNDEKKKVTQFNERLRNTLQVQPPKHFQFKASDGQAVDGWIVPPLHNDADEDHPLVLNIHGGPKSMYGYGFSHTFQLLSAEGYGVVYFNPRGSDGYSEAFADIRQHWGERDYKDLMEGIDHVITTYDWIDPDNLGVRGLSYGGFMTNWIVTHTDRFKAAVSEEGICDWTADFGTSDIGFHNVPDHVGGTPWQNKENYNRQSPIFNIDNVDTPTMLIHALDDYRCHLVQSLEFYTALKYEEKPTKLVLFPKGGHLISRSGKPSWRQKRLRLILDWFDKYLKGKEKLRELA